MGNRIEARPWELFVDTGGTFTDALALSPTGQLLRTKVLSNGALRGVVEERLGDCTFSISHGWSTTVDILRGGDFRLLRGACRACSVISYDPATGQVQLTGDPGPEVVAGSLFEVDFGEEAPVLAARLLTGVRGGDELPPLAMRLGTTLATNALLTRSGADTALFITTGFADLLAIGTQQRPDLFALEIKKPPPIHRQVVEVDERLDAKGKVLVPLDFSALEAQAKAILRSGVKVAAIALLHADRNNIHEEELAGHLRELGFTHVSCSAALAPVIRILPRAATAVVNAYLAPEVETYLAGIRRWLQTGRLLVMTSAGGLVGADSAAPKDLLLSGPAGGVVGAARSAAKVGHQRVISFDMGGTSTDVARYDGDFDYLFEHTVGAAHLFAPALAIETVAAGGGSICRFAGNGLAVGPESAGARPGPAAYGAGGPLTLTDVNLLLGHLDPARFWIPLTLAPAREQLEKVLTDLTGGTGEKTSAEAVLTGFLDIANERMADAIRRISIRRGYDPADYALVAFGGAGGQQACAVATRLGVSRVIVPTDAGLLSALGMSGAVIERFAEEQVLAPLQEVSPQVPKILARLATGAITSLVEEGIPAKAACLRRQLAELRFQGQESTLQVEVVDDHPLDRAFAEKYKDVYGHEPGSRVIELVSLRVVASSRPPELGTTEIPGQPHQPEPEDHCRAWFGENWQQVPVYSREKLKPGAQLTGPAFIFEHHSATVVEPGWHVDLAAGGALILQEGERTRPTTSTTRPEAVQVELFSHRFEAIAREMGEALRRTAVSTNVKERQDFSCALLDRAGELVVNAPHIPVHLGSLGLCVRSVAATLPLAAGDLVVTNHPGFGGSHLPDLTVIAPVFGGTGSRIGYVAARAHHAEIGGACPGSMPSAATNLAAEGVVIPPTHLVREGVGQWESITRILNKGPHPSRGVADNLADLQAAAAACYQGGQALTALARDYGEDQVSHYMAAIKDRSARRMEQVLAQIPDGVYQATEQLDDHTPLAVKITITGPGARVDFSGSAPVHRGNLNATPAIVQSVVIYTLRLLVATDLPLNEGLLRPISLHNPEGILNPPFPDNPELAPAVVGGNVETSQRLVDTLIKALKLCAASQGTMNNVIFGNQDFSYYETVCGGCGAGPGFVGADAVHSHMTNTRITDPEILEFRYPVRLERFALRHGSGGGGSYRGGNGVVREIRFLAPLELSLLTQRRREGPFGMAGGDPGKPGRQYLIRAGGDQVILDSGYSGQMRPGDRLILKTPGGGGYGEAK